MLTLPSEVKELNDALCKLEESARYDEEEGSFPVVVFVLDAVNQLDDNRYNDSDTLPSAMKWLPEKFDSNIMKVIVSCLNGCAALNSLRVLHQPELSCQSLSVSQRKDLVYQWHTKFHKCVEEKWVEKLWLADQCGNTLFLSLALNHLILHGTWASLQDGSCLQMLLTASTVPELIRLILREKCASVRIGGAFCPSLLADICCFIYCSREGLSIKELQDLSGCNDHDFWSFFDFEYQQLLSVNFGVVTFTHAYVIEAASPYLNWRNVPQTLNLMSEMSRFKLQGPW
jgi:hypothetical protein